MTRDKRMPIRLTTYKDGHETTVFGATITDLLGVAALGGLVVLLVILLAAIAPEAAHAAGGVAVNL